MGLLSAVAGLSDIFSVDNVACAGTHPSDIIDMTSWKLQYATSGDTHEEYPIGAFELSPYFKDVNGRVQFRAYCDGGTTSGSQYLRSELREMNSNGSRASWSTSGPTSTLRVTMAVEHTPVVRPLLVVAQIHGTERSYLIVEYDADRKALKGGS